MKAKQENKDKERGFSLFRLNQIEDVAQFFLGTTIRHHCYSTVMFESLLDIPSLVASI